MIGFVDSLAAMREAQSVPVVEVVARARVPGLAWFERDVEHHPPVGKLRSRAGVDQLEDEAAVKIAVGIGGSELVSLVDPAGQRVATSSELMRAHFEDVGEVGTQRHLELKMDRAIRKAHQVQVLVDGLVDSASHGQANLGGGEIADVGRQGRVGELDPDRVVLDGRRGQQRPRDAVDIQALVAEQACVAGENALLAWAH